MVNSALRYVARRVAPQFTARVKQVQQDKQVARELLAQLASAPSMTDRARAAIESKTVRSNQHLAEIVPLLEEMERLRPMHLCEIGADRGGTLALFASVASPRARLLSIDLNYPERRMRTYRRLGRRQQSITCIEADSHAPETLSHAKRWLNSRQLDFLFIDGDHSYDGVKQDFEMYAPLVRPGGIVAFHDIIPDFKTRYNTPTHADVGEVPRFWQELRSRYDNTVEFVENREQDGYGIGVVFV